MWTSVVPKADSHHSVPNCPVDVTEENLCLQWDTGHHHPTRIFPLHQIRSAQGESWTFRTNSKANLHGTWHIQYIGLLKVKATLRSEAVTHSLGWHWTHQSRHMVGPLVCADHHNISRVRGGGEARRHESSGELSAPQHVFSCRHIKELFMYFQLEIGFI